MKKLIGLLVSLSLLTGVLAGCAGTPAGSGAATTTEANVETGAAAAPWPRTIKDALGQQLTLEKNPERVAILDFGFMESMLALGIPPIASTYAERSLNGFGTLQPYAVSVQIEELGEVKALNLEKLVELKPDLILYTAEPENLDMKLYERASQIAPVVTFNSPDWKEQLKDFAECLGEEKKAAAYIADIEALIAESRSKLAGYSDKTVALVFESSGNKGSFVITGSAENPVWFDKENGLGLRPPDGYPGKGEVVSLEGIAAMNPDYIFLFGALGSEADGYKQRYLSGETQVSSVWQSLTAVKNGHVYQLDAAVRAAGPLSIKLGIETIVKSMTK
ncbi:ABC transporter substrate-binding protein|uniref:Iron complex transport system substrate-binding protein n=1 Tax=Dendrosporobacter quercicolus TaxID=146817 RepID=A0A1G9NJ35_9FIRM|nr:ABC transporter substrate-binding protein [Dendrosporobacter quercicolus]NSL47353.1 ABC transporter substrate-binding protein [Dendrosporobacter quercicolus DSM 1736]SDL86401.1 iron complex transport system substrate-binding protein [Dendrosporobacter quercicolus]